MQADIGDIHAAAVAVLGVVVVGADDLKIPRFDIVTAEQPQRDAVDTAVASGGIAGHIHALLGAGIQHPDAAVPRDLDVRDVGTLHERQIGNVQVVRPVDAGDHTVMPDGRLVGVLVPALGLPENGAVLKVQIHAVPQKDRGHDVPAAVTVGAAGQNNVSAAGGGYVIQRRLDGIGVVVYRIAERAEVGHAHGVVGQIEGVGVAVGHLIVFDIEAVGQAQRRLSLRLGEQQELIGKQGGRTQPERQICHAEPTVRGYGRQRDAPDPLFSGGRLVRCAQPVGVRHGTGVQAQLSVRIRRRQGVGAESAGHGQRRGSGIRQAGGHGRTRGLQRLFLLKGVAVQQQGAASLDFQPEAGQPPGATGAGGKVEVQGVHIRVLRQGECHGVLRQVVRRRFGGEGQRGGGKPVRVGKDHEHRVPPGHQHTVAPAGIQGQTPAGKAAASVHGQRHGTAAVGQHGVLRRIEVRLSAPFAQRVPHSLQGKGCSERRAVCLQPEPHRRKVHAGQREEIGVTRAGGADRGEGLSRRAEEGGAVYDAAFGRSDAQSGGTAQHFLHRARQRHVGRCVTGYRQIAQRQQGLRLIERQHDVVRLHTSVNPRVGKVVGIVAVVCLRDSFIGEFVLDKVTRHGMLLSFSGVICSRCFRCCRRCPAAGPP